MTNSRLLIAIVDDDVSVRESLPDLMRKFGFDAAAFSSAQAFLESPLLKKTDCLLLDVVMPGMTGLQLHRELRQQGSPIPIVFITGNINESRRLNLSKQGQKCLQKPFSGTELLSAIQSALRV